MATRVVYVAQGWRRSYDAASDTLYMYALPEDPARLCDTHCVPVDDSDPPEFEITCESVNCETICEPEEVELPNGDKTYNCVCQP